MDSKCRMHDALDCEQCDMNIVKSPASDESECGDLLCDDCGFEIKPPLGEFFGTIGGKLRCASCHVNNLMAVPERLLRGKA